MKLLPIVLCMTLSLMSLAFAQAMREPDESIPFYTYAIASEHPKRDVLVLCSIEYPVEEKILTDLSKRIYKEISGQNYSLVVIDWDYDVNDLFSQPWATSEFHQNTLYSIKMRKADNTSSFVRYAIYPKNEPMQ
ncbi:MAG: hypothetical protein J5803_05005 [Desulfovibrio sp.]|nr:hypothetical protein [Desulfovibrio sp.]